MVDRTKCSNISSGAVSRRQLLRIGASVIPAALVLPDWIRGNAFASTTFDYYISPTGSDSNPGTQSQPWAITALNTKQSTYAGKKVGLLDGTYNVFSLFSAVTQDGYSPALKIMGGTSASPTFVGAVNRGKAIIQANSGTTYPPNNPVLGNYTSSNKEYTTIDGLVVTGSSSKGMYFGDYGAASTGVRYRGIVIQNCELTGSNGSSLSYGNNLSMLELAGAVGALISNNYFHDNIGYSANNADHFSATIQWYCENAIYEYNTLVNSGGLYGKEVGNFGTTIRYNYVDTTNWNTSAIADFVGASTVSRGAPTIIHHNVLIASKAADMRPTLGVGYLPDPLQFFNNTLCVLSSGQSSGLMICLAGGGANIYNNIVYSQASGDQALCALNVEAPGVVNYNLYFDTAGSYAWNTLPMSSPAVRSSVSGAGLAGWTSAMNGKADVNSVSGSDPLFVKSGARAAYYRLQAGSPAKNRGSTNGTSTGSGTDLGAWGNSPPGRIGCDLTSPQPAAMSIVVS